MTSRISLVWFVNSNVKSKRFDTSSAAIDYAKNILKITDFIVRGIMVFGE